MLKTFSIVLLLLFTLPSAGVSESLVFIVNRSNNTPPLTLAEVRRLYLKKQKFWKKSGKAINPINFPPESSEFQKFQSGVLEMDTREYSQHWLARKQITGEAKPRIINSPNLIAAVVARDESVIGYVTKKFLVEGVDPRNKKKLRVVATLP